MMNVFEQPNNLNKSIYYNTSAPWKRSNAAPKLQGWNDSNVSYSGFGSFDHKEIDGGVRLKLNLLQLLGAPVIILGIICFFGGLFVQFSACPDKHGRQAHPIIANSFWYSVLGGIGIVIVGIVIFCLGLFILKKRNEVFKKEIVQKRLNDDFEITDYLYNSEISVANYTQFLLGTLNIRHDMWNKIEYSDYIVGRYHAAPFIFFDCKLYNYIRVDKESKNYLLFGGQVIVLKMRKPVDYSCRFFLTSTGIDVREHHFDLNVFENLLNGTLLLKDKNELSNTGDGKDEPPQQRLNNSTHEASQFLSSVRPLLLEVAENAQCNVGWILNGSYLAIILENGFDPFEYGFTDLFRSSKKISNRVDKQVQWLCSVLEPHVRAGLI